MADIIYTMHWISSGKWGSLSVTPRPGHISFMEKCISRMAMSGEKEVANRFLLTQVFWWMRIKKFICIRDLLQKSRELLPDGIG